ncbi:hypothetical protein S245_059565, partial [Arachis hypogaea]
EGGECFVILLYVCGVICADNDEHILVLEDCQGCYDIEKDKLTFTKVHEFLPNKIYHHGCLKSFFQITKWKAR